MAKLSFQGLNRVILCSLLSLLLIGGCDRQERPATASTSHSTVIITSIFPLQSLLQQMVGDTMPVVSFMPPGANPHDFEPTAQQIAALSDADMMVMVGLNLDPWALKAAKARKIPVISMAELVGLAKGDEHSHHHHDGHDHTHNHHDHAGPNNHLWLNLEYASKMVESLAPILAKRHPDKADVIHTNSRNLIEELTKLDQEFAAMLKPVAIRELVTFHNAFDPLVERYGLKVVAHLAEIELAPGGEVRPTEMVQAIEAIRKYRLRTIYAEPQFPAKAVEQIARETGVRVLKLDPEGNPHVPGYTTYQEMLRSNVKTLVEGQNKD